MGPYIYQPTHVCRICGIEFYTKPALRWHVDNDHNHAPVNIDKQEAAAQKAQDSIIPCPACYGAGWLPELDNIQEPSRYAPAIMVPCHACGGTGGA